MFNNPADRLVYKLILQDMENMIYTEDTTAGIRLCSVSPINWKKKKTVIHPFSNYAFSVKGQYSSCHGFVFSRDSGDECWCIRCSSRVLSLLQMTAGWTGFRPSYVSPPVMKRCSATNNIFYFKIWMSTGTNRETKYCHLFIIHNWNTDTL